MSEVKIVNKGNSKEFTVDSILTEKEAILIQNRKGYHQTGYGFFGFKTEENRTVWRCYRSCD